MSVWNGGRKSPIWIDRSGAGLRRRIRSSLKVGKLKFSVSKDGGGGGRGRGREGISRPVGRLPEPRRCKLREKDKFMQLREGSHSVQAFSILKVLQIKHWAQAMIFTQGIEHYLKRHCTQCFIQ